ncbi:dihydrofolate reductase [Gracilibacillus sp. YIM 98692]|uniref:dihydrofolate reductase n=1 Tax=Gracilibacillus sp. YIM 98692 TaxID=2663532 RepID=UPI0013D883BB|nr:dihydrofolate reductase [Gracilibacillus sp. YIM 98692]
MISLLFAMGKNRVIGKNNTLPWYLPDDLKFFKQLTTSKTIVMGRKTFDSMNGPLPNRKNVVLTKNKSFTADGCTVIDEIEDIKQLEKESSEEEIFVIGGEEIFKQTLHIADRIYMTYIDESFDGDTFFPNFDEAQWQISKKTKGPKDEKNKYDYYYIQYDRNK